MGKRSQRVAASKRASADSGRNKAQKLWGTQQSKSNNGTGWDDVLAQRSQRQSKPVMMMDCASDRIPFGVEQDSPTGLKRRLWPNA